jgi:hypothetical protein
MTSSKACVACSLDNRRKNSAQRLKWAKEYYAKNPDKAKVRCGRVKEYYAKNPDKAKEQAERAKEYYAKNPGKARERAAKAKEYYAKNPDKLKAKADQKKEYYAKNPDKAKAKYEQKVARREKVFVDAAGRPRPSRCEVCNRDGRIVFDHCHSTGHFRGWICSGCNIALGGVKDTPEILRKLAEYLEKH